MLWQRGDELLSVLPLDQETRKWRQTEDTEFDCVKSRFAKAGEVPACPPIAAELRRGDRVLHYEYWELDAVRRLGPLYESAQQPREFTRLLELQRAALLIEGRAGLVRLCDWRCVLRMCTDALLVEEPFSRIKVVGSEFSCGLAGESGVVFYCIAVGERAQNLLP